MAEPTVLSLEQFRAAASAEKGADAVTGAVVRVAMPAEVKADAEGGERAIEFILSTDSLDRHGDSVSQDGWDLKNYKKNPVVCWAHDYSSLPVAKARNIRVEDGALKARAIFTPAGQIRFNDLVYELCRDGFLNACSVGFQPRKWNWAEDDERRFGIDFMEQELLEFSVVPVPANPQALIEARALIKRVDPDGSMASWARGFLGVPEGVEDIGKSLDEFTALQAEFERVSAEAKRLGEELAALASANQQENDALAGSGQKNRQKRKSNPARDFPRLVPRALALAKLKQAG